MVNETVWMVASLAAVSLSWYDSLIVKSFSLSIGCSSGLRLEASAFQPKTDSAEADVGIVRVLLLMTLLVSGPLFSTRTCPTAINMDLTTLTFESLVNKIRYQDSHQSASGRDAQRGYRVIQS